MKLTKNILREQYEVHNPFEIAKKTNTKVYIDYCTALHGRMARNACWQVLGVGFNTDPDAPWYNYGNKTFNVWGRDDKESKRLEAISWTSEKYGIAEWEKSPFGSYHPKGTLEKLTSNGGIA